MSYESVAARARPLAITSGITFARAAAIAFLIDALLFLFNGLGSIWALPLTLIVGGAGGAATCAVAGVAANAAAAAIGACERHGDGCAVGADNETFGPPSDEVTPVAANDDRIRRSRASARQAKHPNL
ncbi:MAG TPA: hypothetical protein VGO80_09820 [Solirubrobacteraceae bacterium]|nr:hypothetical protein [Solirubrobacteraceae bacterium]